MILNQDLDTIVEGLKKHCDNVFSEMQNGMTLEVSAIERRATVQALNRYLDLQINVTHRARWWLAHPENAYFQTLERAIEKIWGQKPLRIREGGVSAVF